MSTRCVIGKLNTNGSVTSIYCHHDGYPSWVGKQLLDHYNTEETINPLLALGDTSGIDESLDKCSPYARDRGEDLNQSYSSPSFKDFESVLHKHGGDIEYVYLFKDGKWFYHAGHRPADFIELTQEICDRD